MIGCLKPDRKSLSREDYTAYRSVYCTLCHALCRGYSLAGMAVLNHEVTLLLLLTIALQEAEPDLSRRGCPAFPLARMRTMEPDDPWFQAAALVSVYIAAGEVQDNVMDEGGLFWRGLSAVADGVCRRADRLLPEEGAWCGDVLTRYHQDEKQPQTPREALALFGKMITDLLDPLICCIAPALQGQVCGMMDAVAQWLFLADACDDQQQDRKRGRENLLDGLVDPAAFAAEEMAACEERIRASLALLPIRRYQSLLTHLLIDRLAELGQQVRKKVTGVDGQ